jgi:hypothetical protein
MLECCNRRKYKQYANRDININTSFGAHNASIYYLPFITSATEREKVKQDPLHIGFVYLRTAMTVLLTYSQHLHNLNAGYIPSS